MNKTNILITLLVLIAMIFIAILIAIGLKKPEIQIREVIVIHKDTILKEIPVYIKTTGKGSVKFTVLPPDTLYLHDTLYTSVVPYEAVFDTVLTGEFAIKDTMELKIIDSLRLTYTFPDHIFEMEHKMQVDYKTINTTIERLFEKELRWYEKPKTYFYVGVFTGFTATYLIYSTTR